jgi:hypothetical protein
MTKVFLLSSFERPEEDTHWASPYYALRRAFTETRSRDWALVEAPEDADLILICPRPRNPVFPIEIFRSGIAWKYRQKCVVISTDDNPTLTHKGFYTCLRAGATHSPWLQGGFYPFVTYAEPHDAFTPHTDFQFLFSFLGSFRTHPVRERIGKLAANAWHEAKDSFLIKDTSRDSGNRQHDFRQQYITSLRDSKFILCPRGMCPSSVRLFETMKAGRVPVIISDEWVPPREIDWAQFAIFVPESELASLPNVLAREERHWPERAQIARAVWERSFSADALANTVTQWGVSLIADARNGNQLATHLTTLLSQVIRWRFVRRGVVSELHRHRAAR